MSPDPHHARMARRYAKYDPPSRRERWLQVLLLGGGSLLFWGALGYGLWRSWQS